MVGGLGRGLGGGGLHADVVGDWKRVSSGGGREGEGEGE